MRELKTDVERQMLSAKPSVAGDYVTARQSAGFESWIVTNDDRGTGGSSTGFSGGTVAAPVDAADPADTRTFSETILKNVMKARADSGATSKTTQLYMGSHGENRGVHIHRHRRTAQ